MIRSFEGNEPEIHPDAYVDPEALLIGNVQIEEDANIWPGVVLRGDLNSIVVRTGANVQDNAVSHSEPDSPTEIGPYVTVGHGAVIHGATIQQKSMVGMNAVVLDHAVVGPRSIVSSGAVVTEGHEVPSEVLVAGSPAEVKKDIDPDSPWMFSGEFYVDLAQRHADSGSESFNDTPS